MKTPPSGGDSRALRSARLLWTGLLVLLLATGCAQKAAKDGHGGEALSDSERATIELRQSIGIVDDPELLAYVEGVGRRITAQGKRKSVEYRFYILDMPVPNALALPDGQIFISRGVLVLVNSEDELAGILAHEIAHVEERHADARAGLNMVTSPIRLGTGIAGWATGLIIPGLGDAIVEFGESTSSLVLAPYSREQEREADRVGQSLAAAAGYQPQGLVDLLDTMADAEALDPENRPEESFFDTHPATEERVELSREHGRTLTPAARPLSAKNRDAVLQELAGLTIGENPGKGFFDENWFVHPELAFVMAFPPDWSGINAAGFVGAQAPNEETFVMLALVAKGSDPMDGAKAASRKLDLDLVSEAKAGAINGLQAARNQVQITSADGQEQKLELTWIAYGGLIYQVMGVSAVERFESVQVLMRQSAASFRALSDEERSQILVTRLEIVEARQGESIAELAERVESPWSAQAISVVNRKPESAPLTAGERIKVGLRKSYVVRPRIVSTTPSQPPVSPPRR